MTGRRGALPLALLIFGVLVAGVVIALMRVGEGPDDGKAGPTPTKTKTASPTTKPTDKMTPTPDGTATATPTDGATATPTDGATATPTDGATGTPTDGGTGATQTPTDGATPLAKTGGSTAPWLLFGTLLIGLSALLGRLARRPS